MSKIRRKVWNALKHNPKTSAAAVIGFIAMLLSHFGVLIPEGLQAEIAGATAVIIGILASDDKD